MRALTATRPPWTAQTGPVNGRFAPSPTGALHVGNLRTALLAWLVGRSADGGGFLVRMEDLDRATASRTHERRQLDDLGALGLDWDPPVVRQSERFACYESALARLAEAGLTYECYCSRREIREAASAPHAAGDGSLRYPGTCRDLSAGERSVRRAARPPALRLRSGTVPVTFTDVLAGPVTAPADDVVLRRNDGVPAYNLAVVVDDGIQGVTSVVRGDDLLSVTPSQVLLQDMLGYVEPRYVHVPLVVGPDGVRLAKRHGAVTLGDLSQVGIGARQVAAALGRSLGVTGADPSEMLTTFDLSTVVARGRAPVPLAELDLSPPG